MPASRRLTVKVLARFWEESGEEKSQDHKGRTNVLVSFFPVQVPSFTPKRAFFVKKSSKMPFFHALFHPKKRVFRRFWEGNWEVVTR